MNLARLAAHPAARKAVVALFTAIALALLLIYLEGGFSGGKVKPGLVPLPTAGRQTAGLAVVEKREAEDVREWPGTIRSRATSHLSSRRLARVLEVRATVGAAVKAGEILALLDDRDVRARLEQARAALEAARAGAAQAEAEHERVRRLFEKQAATPRDFEAAEARGKAARARIAQAESAVRESEVEAGESVIRAPFDGVVSERAAEPGDLAVPGRPLFAVYDPARLRLEVDVPEACAAKATRGVEIRVRVDAPERELAGRVEEVTPVADPQSRTFLVKVALPEDGLLRPGAFARLLQPCGARTALLVPASAVSRSGQIESVRVMIDGELRVRHVRTGRRHGDRIEVLSGLREGDLVRIEP